MVFSNENLAMDDEGRVFPVGGNLVLTYLVRECLILIWIKPVISRYVNIDLFTFTT